MKDGLPSFVINSLAKTPDGYLWVGTSRGLARYDGNRFTVFDHVNHPELRSRYIGVLASDRAGGLLVGTATAGAFRLQNGRFVQLLSETITGEPYELLESRDRSVWMGTSRGVFRLPANGGMKHYTTQDGLPCDATFGLAEDSTGAIWVGTSCGVARFDGTRFVGVPALKDLDGATIWRLMFTRAGALFVATRNGVAVLEKGRLRRVSADSAICFVEDRHGSVWIGTPGELQRLAPGAKTAVASKRQMKTVFALLEDREGAIWAGTSDHLEVVRESLFTPLGSSNGLSDVDLLAVTTDPNGRLVFSTDNGGIYRLNGDETETLLAPPRDRPRAVWTLAFGADGRLWAGTVGDSALVLTGSKITRLGPRDTRMIVPRADGSAWALSGSGELLEVWIDGRSGPLQASHGSIPTEVHRIMPARDGGIWISSRDRRLTHLDAQRRTRTAFLGELPYAVLEDADGTLWIGTIGGGLVRVQNGRKTVYRQRHGLPDDDVVGVTDDGHGWLWISTSAGLARVSRRELDAFAKRPVGKLHADLYTAADGMPSTTCVGGEPAVARTSDGKLWFATATGLAGIDPHPQRMKRAPLRLNALIESVAGAWEAPRVLSSKRRPLTFRFTAPAFANPEKVVIRYKLVGFDEEWIEAGTSRTASYTNLPHGDYRFIVQARTQDGVWPSEASAHSSFAFRKERAMHETIWFRSLIILGVMGIAAFVHLLRVRFLRVALDKRRSELEDLVSERTALLKTARDTAMSIAASHAELSRRNRLILDSAAEGIFGLDAEGRTMFINVAGADLLGLTKEDLVGEPLHPIVHPNFGDDASRCPICAVVEAGLTSGTICVTTRSGRVVPVDYTASLITSESRGHEGVVVTFRDISERLAVERMKDEFVSTVSHELRTPMTSIHGALGLLSGGMLGDLRPQAKRMLQIALQNSDRLIRLINDILDVERLSSGRIQLQLTTFDLRELIQQAADVMQAMAQNAGVAIEVDASALEIHADADRIMQVLTNLISNAIKFSPPRSAIRLSAAASNDEAVIHVMDQGRGIPPRKLELVFERFRQVDASDAREKGGSGLGLAICKGIAEAHGGSISVTSTVGVGSTFCVRIPLRPREADADLVARLAHLIPSASDGGREWPKVG